MWELRSNDGPRVFRVKHDSDDRCKICGQHYKKDDEYYLIVCNAISQARDAGLNNLLAHVDCWDGFCHGISDDLVLATKLKKHKAPKLEPLTEEQNKAVEAFISAVNCYGYSKLSKTSAGEIKAIKPGTTQYVTYSPYSQAIRYYDRRKKALFSSLVERQIETNIYNKMHVILGDGKHDDYSAVCTINNIVEETNKFFG